MKPAYLVLTSVLAPAVITACASSPQGGPPAPAPMPPAFVSEQPTTAPVLAVAEAAPTPADAPAMNNQDLPSGHPDIAQLLEQRKQAKTNAKMNGELPAGHPPISGMPARGIMPGQKMQPAAPSATQPAMFGTLIVRAVQGTAGGPAVGELPVTIELHQGDQLMDKNEAKLAADGSLRIDDIPLALNVTPVVKV